VLKEKILLALVVTALFAASFAWPVWAYASVSIYGYMDKALYAQGEKGTLKIWVYNDGTDNVTLKSVTIEYPWYGSYIWEGNETIDGNGAVIPAGGNWSTITAFTIPTDGRGAGGDIHIHAFTDKVNRTHNIGIEVADPQSTSTSRYMEQISTMLTILAVLVTVCTAALAATIFLSARRPQIMWKTEDKGQ
jgi:hypothetical protein